METEITFEPSGRSGLIAVGTYLSDAASRLGVELEANEEEENDESNERDADWFPVTVKSGNDLLSPPTAIELERLSDSQRRHGRRLAYHAKIEKQGEIVVMVSHKKKPKEDKHEKKVEEFHKEFQELPLEKKVANLLELEAITLSETFSFVLNSPFKIVGKLMDVMAEFGLKIENDSKKAKRPAEHHEKSNGADDNKTPSATDATHEPPVEAS